MSETTPVLTLSGEAIAKLAQLVGALIEAKEVSEADRDAAKAKAAELIASDEANKAVADANLVELNKLIDLASKATAPVQPVEEVPVVESDLDGMEEV